MKSIAFIFTRGPHGSSFGREGLDAILALLSFSDNIALFFVSDGVLQLTTNQKPDLILARNYIATFSLLSLYEVRRFYICSDALVERGMVIDVPNVLGADVLSPKALRLRLNDYDRFVTF
ncbi:sulfurtransferase complex subunit TusC [Candidatus Erwinia haradaeae]|uniref:Protein TusC n=1 Tax=Candidatus Erwinia haradaeae TaxID=1922217 RepID=A0A451D7U2_9GAMM|nr:sulfurtransferase complex subunit TusC [Candidatus Erwinia haradaeae]VFP81919.1 Protein TusC [Candidatus Erwinia haradaeae]